MNLSSLLKTCLGLLIISTLSTYARPDESSTAQPEPNQAAQQQNDANADGALAEHRSEENARPLGDASKP